MEADLVCNNTSVESDLFNRESRVRLQTELDNTKFCHQLVIITITEFVIFKFFFFNQNTRNFESFFASSEKKIGSVESCTVQLLRHDSYIRTVDSQSDLRILL